MTNFQKMMTLHNDFSQNEFGYLSNCGRVLITIDATRPKISQWVTLIDGELATNIYGAVRGYANPRAAAMFVKPEELT